MKLELWIGALALREIRTPADDLGCLPSMTTSAFASTNPTDKSITFGLTVIQTFGS